MHPRRVLLPELQSIVCDYAVSTTIPVRVLDEGGRIHLSYRGILPSAHCRERFRTSLRHVRGRVGELVHTFESEHPDPRFTSESHQYCVDFVVFFPKDDVYLIVQWANDTHQPVLEFLESPLRELFAVTAAAQPQGALAQRMREFGGGCVPLQQLHSGRDRDDRDSHTQSSKCPCPSAMSCVLC